MEDFEMKVALFSGRFSPPHLGHILTLNKFCEKYDFVVVVILAYKDRFDMQRTVDIFSELMKYSLYNSKWHMIHNWDHFRKISCHELKKILLYIEELLTPSHIDSVTYVGGNKAVNKHIESLNLIPVEYMPRSEFYNSTEIREDIKRGKTLEEIYGINNE
jgi:nicotinamide mononucleotide adenylyltransferase